MTCDVSILVVGYNSRDHLAACLGSIRGAVGQRSYEVRFVNNGTDESEAYVRQAFPDVQVLESRGNVGFAAANNHLAEGASGEWLLLLNPDTELADGAIDTLLAAANSPGTPAILGSLNLAPGQSGDRCARLEFPSLANLWAGVIGKAATDIDLTDGSVIVDVDAVSGACMLVKADVWRQLDGMDESFFLYAEELDLCWRHRKQGGSVGLVPASRVTHDTGSGELYAPRRMLFQMTGNAHFYRKNFSAPYALACIATQWISAWSRFALGGLLGLRKPAYRDMSRGFRTLALKPWLWMRGYRRGSTDPRG